MKRFKFQLLYIMIEINTWGAYLEKFIAGETLWFWVFICGALWFWFSAYGEMVESQNSR
jgi:hypothetical protein